MTTWSEYQSVVQLGAALNFGFGALEAVSRQPLVLLNRRFLQRLEEIRHRGMTDASSEELIDLDRSKRIARFASKSVKALQKLNPYLSIISGFVAVVVLVAASNNAAARISVTVELIVIGACYGLVYSSGCCAACLRRWIEVNTGSA